MELSSVALIPLAAFVGAFLATRRSLGLGLGCVFAVGYFHGIIRANILSTYTTFLFDAAVLGLYLSLYLRPPPPNPNLKKTSIVTWITALILWPLIVASIPQNDILVQFVAFRATAFFIPMLWLGTRITDDDIQVVARVLAVLNLIALAFGLYEYFVGVEVLYPLNQVTQIIYNSNDVAGGYLRIPATFLNAHAYGGTMVNTLPFLLGQMLKRRSSDLERTWLLIGVIAAGGGILLCAARQPILVAAVLLFLAWSATGFSPRVGVGLTAAVVVLGFVVGVSERLQRFMTLTETQLVVGRIRGSINENLIDIIFSYPFGAGMGSAAGTSIPYFLLDRAPRSIGLENEFCRIAVDQGWIGLLLWVGLLYWIHWPPLKRSGPNAADPMLILMYALTIATWCTAFLGAGLLTSIPGSAMLLTQMGIVAARRSTDTHSRPPRLSSRSQQPDPAPLESGFNLHDLRI